MSSGETNSRLNDPHASLKQSDSGGSVMAQRLAHFASRSKQLKQKSFTRFAASPKEQQRENQHPNPAIVDLQPTNTVPVTADVTTPPSSPSSPPHSILLCSKEDDIKKNTEEQDKIEVAHDVTAIDAATDVIVVEAPCHDNDDSESKPHEIIQSDDHPSTSQSQPILLNDEKEEKEDDGKKDKVDSSSSASTSPPPFDVVQKMASASSLDYNSTNTDSLESPHSANSSNTNSPRISTTINGERVVTTPRQRMTSTVYGRGVSTPPPAAASSISLQPAFSSLSVSLSLNAFDELITGTVNDDACVDLESGAKSYRTQTSEEESEKEEEEEDFDTGQQLHLIARPSGEVEEKKSDDEDEIDEEIDSSTLRRSSPNRGDDISEIDGITVLAYGAGDMLFEHNTSDTTGLTDFFGISPAVSPMQPINGSSGSSSIFERITSAQQLMRDRIRTLESEMGVVQYSRDESDHPSATTDPIYELDNPFFVSSSRPINLSQKSKKKSSKGKHRHFEHSSSPLPSQKKSVQTAGHSNSSPSSPPTRRLSGEHDTLPPGSSLEDFFNLVGLTDLPIDSYSSHSPPELLLFSTSLQMANIDSNTDGETSTLPLPSSLSQKQKLADGVPKFMRSYGFASSQSSSSTSFLKAPSKRPVPVPHAASAAARRQPAKPEPSPGNFQQDHEYSKRESIHHHSGNSHTTASHSFAQSPKVKSKDEGVKGRMSHYDETGEHLQKKTKKIQSDLEKVVHKRKMMELEKKHSGKDAKLEKDEKTGDDTSHDEEAEDHSVDGEVDNETDPNHDNDNDNDNDQYETEEEEEGEEEDEGDDIDDEIYDKEEEYDENEETGEEEDEEEDELDLLLGEIMEYGTQLFRELKHQANNQGERFNIKQMLVQYIDLLRDCSKEITCCLNDLKEEDNDDGDEKLVQDLANLKSMVSVTTKILKSFLKPLTRRVVDEELLLSLERVISDIVTHADDFRQLYGEENDEFSSDEDGSNVDDDGEEEELSLDEDDSETEEDDEEEEDEEDEEEEEFESESDESESGSQGSQFTENNEDDPPIQPRLRPSEAWKANVYLVELNARIAEDTRTCQGLVALYEAMENSNGAFTSTEIAEILERIDVSIRATESKTSKFTQLCNKHAEEYRRAGKLQDMIRKRRKVFDGSKELLLEIPSLVEVFQVVDSAANEAQLKIIKERDATRKKTDNLKSRKFGDNMQKLRDAEKLQYENARLAFVHRLGSERAAALLMTGNSKNTTPGIVPPLSAEEEYKLLNGEQTGNDDASSTAQDGVANTVASKGPKSASSRVGGEKPSTSSSKGAGGKIGPKSLVSSPTTTADTKLGEKKKKKKSKTKSSLNDGSMKPVRGSLFASARQVMDDETSKFDPSSSKSRKTQVKKK